jgi:hypothetical protein
VQEISEHAERIDEPGTGGVQEMVAIHGPQASLADSPQAGEVMTHGRHGRFGHDPLEREAARSDDHAIRIGRGHRGPLDPVGVLAGVAEHVSIPGPVNEISHPVASGHRWVKPFDDGDLIRVTLETRAPPPRFPILRPLPAGAMMRLSAKEAAWTSSNGSVAIGASSLAGLPRNWMRCRERLRSVLLVLQGRQTLEVTVGCGQRLSGVVPHFL